MVFKYKIKDTLGFRKIIEINDLPYMLEDGELKKINYYKALNKTVGLVETMEHGLTYVDLYNRKTGFRIGVKYRRLAEKVPYLKNIMIGYTLGGDIIALDFFTGRQK